MLIASGHRVRALVWGSSPERVEAAGCEYIPIDGPTFDLEARSWEGQADDSLFVGRAIADLVLEQARRWEADVVVVDCWLRSALCGADASGLPTAVLVHVQHAFLDVPTQDDPEIWDGPSPKWPRFETGLTSSRCMSRTVRSCSNWRHDALGRSA
jgi:hypothetical protein